MITPESGAEALLKRLTDIPPDATIPLDLFNREERVNEESEARRRNDRTRPDAETGESEAIGKLRTILQACPEFMSWARNFYSHIHNWRDFVRLADQLRPMVGVSEDAWAAAKVQMGKPAAAAALALLFEKVHAGEVTSPGGYLRGMVAKARAGELHLARSFFGRLKGMAA